MLLPSQVLESLKNVAAPEPFALQNQYVPAVLAARAQDGEDDADDESDDGDRKAPPKKSKGKPDKPKAPKRKAEPKPGSEWKYGSIRTGLIPAGLKGILMQMPRACGMRAQRKPAIWHQLVLRNLRNAGSYLLGPPSTHGLKKSMGQPTELAICDGTKHKPSISEQNWGMFCLVGKMHVATRHNVVDIRQTYRHMMSQKSDFVFLYMF